MEACRIGIVYRGHGVYDVGAPMKHKNICYEMLVDAVAVVARTAPQHFRRDVTQWAIVMDVTGRVDVSAPIPHNHEVWIKEAKKVIEAFDDSVAPELRPFSAAVMGV